MRKILKANQILLAAVLCLGVPLLRGDDQAGWRDVENYPQLHYKPICVKNEAVNLFWRSDYPVPVSLKVRLKSTGYDTTESLRVFPGEIRRQEVDTDVCSLSSLRVSVTKFAMDPLPPKPPADPAKPASKEAPPAPPVTSLIRFDPNAEKLPEIKAEAMESISVGMRQDAVVEKLGKPASKLAIPEEGQLRESYQYRTADNKIAVIRFLNGAVVEIDRPQ